VQSHERFDGGDKEVHRSSEVTAVSVVQPPRENPLVRARHYGATGSEGLEVADMEPVIGGQLSPSPRQHDAAEEIDPHLIVLNHPFPD